MTAPPVRPVVGTAAWSIPAAVRTRFPVTGSLLQRYGAVLDGVEINSSFYRPHRRATYARWAASVPGPFRFAVKVPQSMTHERRLVDCEALMDRFAEEVDGLGDKRGPLLVQLPPSLAFASEAAARFLRALQARGLDPLVCEPRHRSWFTAEAEQLMVECRVARVAADPAPVPGAGEPGGAATLIYRRLHGAPRIYYSDYPEDVIAVTAGRLAAEAARGVPTWCIFDNTALGHALGNALAVRDRLASGAS